ncbi:hypothetical protein BKA81DRAFT_363368 [Phyllosticta paracitricarpa]
MSRRGRLMRYHLRCCLFHVSVSTSKFPVFLEIIHISPLFMGGKHGERSPARRPTLPTYPHQLHVRQRTTCEKEQQRSLSPPTPVGLPLLVGPPYLPGIVCAVHRTCCAALDYMCGLVSWDEALSPNNGLIERGSLVLGATLSLSMTFSFSLVPGTTEQEKTRFD